MKKALLLMLAVAPFACLLLGENVTQSTSLNGNYDCSSVVLSEGEIYNFIIRDLPNDTNVRPIKDSTSAVIVYLSLSLLSITELVERDLIMEGYLSLDWQNDYLVWKNDFPYNCTETLLVDRSIMWSPDLNWVIGSFNKDDSATSIEKAFLYSSGDVAYWHPGEIAASCFIDLTMFPFDEQLCHIVIESFNYPDAMQSLVFYHSKPLNTLDLWIENEIWTVATNTSTIVAESEARSTPKVMFSMVLRRKPLYYYVNIIVPCMIISTVELVSFILPLNCVARIQISFSCLLAFSMFQNMISDEIPKSSQSLPLLTIFISLQMAYVGIIALLGEVFVFLLLRQANAIKQPPPAKWLSTCLGTIGRVLRVSPVEIYNSQAAAFTSSSSEEWSYLAQVVEILNLWAYILAVVITPVVLFNLPSPPPKFNSIE